MTKFKFNSTEYNPPDGGWGWIIVVAYGIANVILFFDFDFDHI